MSASVRDQFHAAAGNIEELGDIDRAITSAVQRRHRSLAATAAAGVTCVAIVAAVFFGAGPGVSQPEPLRPPTPSPPLTPDINSWPGAARNPPGAYSLDPVSNCGHLGTGPSCNQGWMHNGYGSGDVEIWIVGTAPGETSMPAWAKTEIGPGGGGLDGRTPVVVAGHDGFYRRVDDRRERWMVDIDGAPVAIQLTANPGTSRADMAEAHAIIDSMRTVPSDHQYIGFSLVFTLTSNDWDSG